MNNIVNDLSNVNLDILEEIRKRAEKRYEKEAEFLIENPDKWLNEKFEQLRNLSIETEKDLRNSEKCPYFSLFQKSRESFCQKIRLDLEEVQRVMTVSFKKIKTELHYLENNEKIERAMQTIFFFNGLILLKKAEINGYINLLSII